MYQEMGGSVQICSSEPSHTPTGVLAAGADLGFDSRGLQIRADAGFGLDKESDSLLRSCVHFQFV